MNRLKISCILLLLMVLSQNVLTAQRYNTNKADDSTDQGTFADVPKNCVVVAPLALITSTLGFGYQRVLTHNKSIFIKGGYGKSEDSKVYSSNISDFTSQYAEVQLRFFVLNSVTPGKVNIFMAPLLVYKAIQYTLDPGGITILPYPVPTPYILRNQGVSAYGFGYAIGLQAYVQKHFFVDTYIGGTAFNSTGPSEPLREIRQIDNYTNSPSLHFGFHVGYAF